MDLINRIEGIVGRDITEAAFVCSKCGSRFASKRADAKTRKCFKCGGTCERCDESMETWLNWWGRTTQIYLSPNNEVRWSPSWEFPPGTIMTEDEVIEARRRGYVIIPWS